MIQIKAYSNKEQYVCKGTALLFMMSIRSISYSEEALVQRLKLHDEQAYHYFYDHYGKAIFGVIYPVVPNQEAAEDILQEVFVKIWKHIGSYDPKAGFLPGR